MYKFLYVLYFVYVFTNTFYMLIMVPNILIMLIISIYVHNDNIIHILTDTLYIPKYILYTQKM